MKFTDFHSAAAVCSASRVALMTGCYPQRVGILGALGPNANVGIIEEEVLLPAGWHWHSASADHACDSASPIHLQT